MTPETLHRLMSLCGALRDGVLTELEFTELDELLRQNPEAQDYYLDYIYLCTDLCNLQAASYSEAEEDTCCDSTASPLTLEMLKVLGDYEKEAEIVELPEPEDSKKDLIRKVSLERPPRTMSPLSLVTFLTSLAALLFVLVYVHLNSPAAFEVATLSGSVDAEWSSPLPLQKGLRLSASSEMIHLQSGVIEIESDKGVKILMEAPAGFTFSSPDEIHMDYGRAFASVPPAGSGFAIQTKNSKVIDLGTEFGVYSDLKGETELHVFKGNTILIAGDKHNPKKTMEVSGGQAMQVAHADGRVADIHLNRRMFVQQIDEPLGLVWRGDKVLNLADVVGGGSGLGTGQTDAGLNPSDRPDDAAGELRDRRGTNAYNRVSTHPFIDGVFVPNGAEPQAVTSTGTVFADCPATSGYFFADILNTPRKALALEKPGLSHAALTGADASFLCLHANAGITFDLNAVRRTLPGVRVLRFRSTLGIADCAPADYMESQAEFWILVDGRVSYSKLMTRGAFEPVEIELSETDRFLTLMATDGGFANIEIDRNAIGYDWCLFGEPVLVLQ